MNEEFETLKAQSEKQVSELKARIAEEQTAKKAALIDVELRKAFGSDYPDEPSKREYLKHLANERFNIEDGEVYDRILGRPDVSQFVEALKETAIFRPSPQTVSDADNASAPRKQTVTRLEWAKRMGARDNAQFKAAWDAGMIEVEG